MMCYLVLHDMARRMIVPSRAAMFGDYVGRGSTDYVLLQQFQVRSATPPLSVAHNPANPQPPPGPSFSALPPSTSSQPSEVKLLAY